VVSIAIGIVLGLIAGLLLGSVFVSWERRRERKKQPTVLYTDEEGKRQSRPRREEPPQKVWLKGNISQ
jgi:hypothetical protein